MASHAFSWCSCPYCPSDSNGQLYSTRYLSSVPRYGRSHQHYICEWCDVWGRYAPGYELSDMYKPYAATFEIIHSFFRGELPTSARGTREIYRLIMGVSKYVDGQNEMAFRSYRLRELVRELRELAGDVYNQAIYDMEMYRRLPGGGPWARRQRLLT